MNGVDLRTVEIAPEGCEVTLERDAWLMTTPEHGAGPRVIERIAAGERVPVVGWLLGNPSWIRVRATWGPIEGWIHGDCLVPRSFDVVYARTPREMRNKFDPVFIAGGRH